MPTRTVTYDLPSLRAVAAELAAAAGGSRALDYRLGVASGLLSEKGLSILVSGKPTVAVLAVDRVIPALTTSLDAKLPVEDVVSVRRLDDGTWEAVTVGARDVRVSANAATEVLARRLAATEALILHLARKRTPQENGAIRTIVASFAWEGASSDAGPFAKESTIR